MDGIARNTSGFDSDLSGTLVPVLGGAILLLTGLLVVAIAIELLRCAGVAAGLVRHADRIVPTPARRLAAGMLSLAVTVLGPTPAFATDAPVRDWLAGTATTTTTTSPVATEDALIQRATTPPSPPASPIPPTVVSPTVAPSLPADQTTVVVEGDCLWAIAARRLGPGAGNPAIDAAWHAIYALNRDAIGDDPNLIFPGLQLALPPIDQPPYAAP